MSGSPSSLALMNKFKSSPSAVWRIAANPCAVPFWIFAEAMLPSALYLASRVFLPDWEDLMTETSRTIYQEATRGDRPHKHRRRSRARTMPAPGSHDKHGPGLLPPTFSSNLRRFLWFPIAATEAAGFTYILVNLMDDAAFAWTSLQQFCPECTGNQHSVAMGPLFRKDDLYGDTIGEVWQPTQARTVLQNRASWITSSNSCTVPGGSYWGSFSCKFDLQLTGPLEVGLRTLVTYYYFPLQITLVRDQVTAYTDKDSPKSLMTHAFFEVPIGTEATISFQYRSYNASLPLFLVRDSYMIVSGRSVCSS